jgi:hypothetical protein
MKVRVAVTLDIDPEAWALEYGLPIAETRTDVRAWAASSLHQLAEGMGILRNTGAGGQGA